MFYTAESDVEAFYCSLVCPKWLLSYFALLSVKVEDVLPVDENWVFQCPLSGEIFKAGELATPAWPRLPMGVTNSVELATELARSILQRNVPKGAVSLTIPQDQILAQSAIDLCFGLYIDNLFLFCSNHQ